MRVSEHSASPAFWASVEREIRFADPDELRCFETADQLPVFPRPGFARELWAYLKCFLPASS
jgi:hypothetical protein